MKISKYPPKPGKIGSVATLNISMTPEEHEEITRKFGLRLSLDLVPGQSRCLVLRADSGGSLFGKLTSENTRVIGFSEHKLGNLLYQIPNMARAPVASWAMSASGAVIEWAENISPPRVINRAPKSLRAQRELDLRSQADLEKQIIKAATVLGTLLGQLPVENAAFVSYDGGKLKVGIVERRTRVLFE